MALSVSLKEQGGAPPVRPMPGARAVTVSSQIGNTRISGFAAGREREGQAGLMLVRWSPGEEGNRRSMSAPGSHGHLRTGSFAFFVDQLAGPLRTLAVVERGRARPGQQSIMDRAGKVPCRQRFQGRKIPRRPVPRFT